MADELTFDPMPFLVAIIECQEEVRIPVHTIITDKGEKAMTLDFEDDGATVVLRLIDAEEVPEDVAG